MIRPWPGSAALARINVHAASFLVPRPDRETWTAEWVAELYHLCHAPHDEIDDPSLVDPLQFSLGAFHDAFWICCDHMRSDGLPTLFRSGSASRCNLVLIVFALAGLLLAFVLTGARKALLHLPMAGSANLVLISSNGYVGTQSPSISLADYNEWTTNTANLFTHLAFYRPTVKGIHIEHHETARMTFAQASENLPQLLGLPVPDTATSGNSDEPRLLLTRSAWRKLCHSDSGVIGSTADIDGRPVFIAGILPDGDWRLPGTIDALLLESPATLAALPARTRGFVIARIRSSAFPPPRGGWRKMIETRHGITEGYDCVSLQHLLGQPFIVFLFALLMASLALPATTALPLGEYPRHHDHLPAVVKLRRWIFLLTKFALVMLIVYLFSAGFAYGLFSGNPVTTLYVQLGSAFPALLFAFRWILQDQRRRCPECLRLLSSPARVGQASCNFLSWNGTELFCVRGHGLLHIPELPTSWFSTQRWLCLDASWACLFPDGCSPSPGML